jgi:hypothetical protein
MRETRVPLELVNLHNDGFHLLVEVVVFGQSFNVVLDTGASKTVFDKTVIEKHMKDAELMSSELIINRFGDKQHGKPYDRSPCTENRKI